MRQGYRKVGPGQQVCELCSVRISTNRLAVAGHERGKVHQAALAKENERWNAQQAARTAARARRGLEGRPTEEEKAMNRADLESRADLEDLDVEGVAARPPRPDVWGLGPHPETLAPSVPTRHGAERNRRTVTSSSAPVPVDFVGPDGQKYRELPAVTIRAAIPGSSWTREVMERWCEHCEAWIECDGIMGTLAFTFEHEDKPHPKSVRPLPPPIPPGTPI